MNTPTQMKWQLTLSLLILGAVTLPAQAKDLAAPATEQAHKLEASQPLDLFEAIDQGVVDAKFVARSAAKGRLVLTNKTDQPVNVQLPEAFAGVPVLRQFGGGGGGGGLGGGGGGLGGGGGGGGGQAVGGGGGGGLGGGGGGGLGGGGAFNIAPERIERIDVPLVCLEHGLRDPSSSKPYEIRPIEDVVTSPALIEIVKAFGNGQLPRGATQAAAWHINSGVSWNELAAKLTGTVRSINRGPYFSRQEIQAAMTIVQRAETMTAGQEVYPRNWKSPSLKAAEKAAQEKTEGETYEHKPGKKLDLDSQDKADGDEKSEDASEAKAA